MIRMHGKNTSEEERFSRISLDSIPLSLKKQFNGVDSSLS